MDYWYENGPVKDVTIRRCTFENCGIPVETACGFKPTENAPFYHENIRFTENTVYLAGGNVMNLQDVNGITYSGNTIVGLHDGQLPLRLIRCSNVSVQ